MTSLTAKVALSGGQPALDLRQRRDFDLLLLDFAMPGMNGAEVAEQARAARPDLPIMSLSGYADSAAMDAALDGRALVLTKPVECRALFDAIASATTNAASG